ncbi:hypothetical protein [Halobacterium yunchengense]|uniref:hypothetical protein n=1 Tax=Halobacterium yunchengense TaxID=3108497 RepID=UPI00300BF2CE
MHILHLGLDLPMPRGQAVQVLWTGVVTLCAVGYLLYRDYRAYRERRGESS